VQLLLNSYPNPAKDNSTIQYDIATEELYDISDRKINEKNVF
jgi:hypothetical protein